MKAPKAKVISEKATAAIEASRLAGVVSKDLKGGGVVIKLTSFKEFISGLPTGKTEAVKAFRGLVSAVAKETGTDTGTFIVRPSGSFTIYSKFAEGK